MMAGVYLIKSNDGYKIGRTTRDISHRLKELSAANASALTLVCFYEYKHSSYLESTLHNGYMHKRKSGEWFDLSDEDVVNFSSTCDKIVDMHKLMMENNTWYIEKIVKKRGF